MTGAASRHNERTPLYQRISDPYTGLVGENVHLFQTEDGTVGLTVYDYRGTLTADAYHIASGDPAQVPDRATIEGLLR